MSASLHNLLFYIDIYMFRLRYLPEYIPSTSIDTKFQRSKHSQNLWKMNTHQWNHYLVANMEVIISYRKLCHVTPIYGTNSNHIQKLKMINALGCPPSQ